MDRLVWQIMFFIVDLGSVAIAAISLFCYAFQYKDQYGYSMDGVTTIVCVAAAIFILVVNHHNKIENLRIHSWWK